MDPKRIFMFISTTLAVLACSVILTAVLEVLKLRAESQTEKENSFTMLSSYPEKGILEPF